MSTIEDVEDSTTTTITNVTDNVNNNNGETKQNEQTFCSIEDLYRCFGILADAKEEAGKV